MHNPFTPTFGSIPVELAGRQQLIEDVLEGLRNRSGDPNRSTIFVGAQGTGKTVLLATIARRAENEGWLSSDVTAREGMLGEILVQTRDKGQHLLEPETLTRLSSLHVGPLGIALERNTQPSTWRSEMTRIVKELNDKGTGLLITVDEVSVKLDEMRILIEVYQHFIREGRDVALLLAGLPHNVSMLLRNDEISFLRRAFRHSLEAIETNEVAYAMRETIESSNRTIEPEALRVAAEATQGFAFLVQLVGYHMWRQHPQEPAISADDAHAGIAFAKRHMDEMVIEPTLVDLSPRELEFLEVMAKSPNRMRVADIAQSMGIDPNNASKVRKRLVERGIIGARGRGAVGFDMPMLQEYLREQL